MASARGASEPNAATMSASTEAAECQDRARLLAPRPSGSILSGAGVTPADLFAPVIRVDTKQFCRDGKIKGDAIHAQILFTCVGGPEHVRSFNGLTLMMATEGTIVDVRDDWQLAQLREVLRRGPENEVMFAKKSDAQIL